MKTGGGEHLLSRGSGKRRQRQRASPNSVRKEMEMKIPNAGKHIVVWLGLMLFSVPVPVLALQDENGEVSQILQDARDKAAVLSRDADEMETLTRSDVSWQSHASLL